MNSNKTTPIGIALILLIFFGWVYLNQPKEPLKQNSAASADSSHVSQAAPVTDSAKPAADTAGVTGAPAAASATPDSTTSNSFGSLSTTAQPEVTKVIVTPLFTATLSSKGAMISSFILKNYVTWDNKPLDLVNQQEYHGAGVDLKFVGSDGKVVSTSKLPFQLDPESVTLQGNDSLVFSAVCRIDSNRSIVKIFNFSPTKYAIGITFRLNGLQNTISGYHYTAALENPLPYVEHRTSDEASNAKSFAAIAGDEENITATKAGESTHKAVNGNITYIGSRTQYFVEALIPANKTLGADLNARGVQGPQETVVAHFAPSVNIPIQHAQSEDVAFTLYLGPLDYDRVSALGVGLENVMNFGWSFIVRPISIHLMLPLFMWLHGFMSNWGLVIIVFSILIKLITMPLSTGQMRSMRKMQVLQPKVAEVREKYKDDAKKMNEELLKVYRTYGVNPAGGCLPMVLQMPILFALYSVLRNTIQLRQADFALWIHDLSIPDSLFHFGTKLPFIGDQMSGLTLLLVITMFVQQIFTVTDPRQKSMAYIMPILFIFMFNNLPSGVALYYFMFNIFGLAQQLYLTKIATPMSLDEMKVDPKKSKGGLMARLQDMEQQQRKTRQDQYAGKTPGKGKKR
jgi:YidC/Oxa1 family membrane protein insertase